MIAKKPNAHALVFQESIARHHDMVHELQRLFLRMQMIQKEILKLNALSHKELHELYYSMKDILIYNRDHFASFKDTNPYKISYEFIQQL